MVEIQSVFTILKEASTSKARAPAPKAGSKAAKAETELARRVVLDTVELSSGKMVNLNRGRELANEFRSKPVDEDFVADLRKAMEDIFRINRLFRETVRASFKIGA